MRKSETTLSTNEPLCEDFARWMKKGFEMSMMGELTLFLDLD